MTDQEKLEGITSTLVKKHGVSQAVNIIKNKTPSGLFHSMIFYPHGVLIECHSEKGGVLVGTRL